MTGPRVPKNTGDALRQQVWAMRNRAVANAVASESPIDARWRQLEAIDMERYAAEFLELPEGSAEVGAGGELVPIGETASERLDLVDTVRNQPDLVNARASVARLELVADTSALDLAIDTVETIKARNTLEKMLAHQIAVAHSLAMKFATKSNDLLGNVTSWNREARQQVSSIEAARLANAFARMMDSYSQGVLTLDRLRNGRQQVVTVQHVTVGPGGQAIVAATVKHRGIRRRGKEAR
jgi:hypothetical protein